MREALLILIGACAGSALSLHYIAPQMVPYGPRLAGYGCEGAAGAIYADEESDFPACARIVAIYGEAGQ